MRLKHWLALLVVMSMAGCSSFCAKIPSCGIFTFTGSKVDTSSVNGLDMNLSFDFNPTADCGSNCSCNTVAYIQIVRTVDMEDSTYIYPSAEKEGRANGNGWYIDRLEGKKWGYYGRNDDGTFASTLDPGSENDPAILFDAPSRGEAEPWIDIWWQAVSVPAYRRESIAVKAYERQTQIAARRFLRGPAQAMRERALTEIRAAVDEAVQSVNR